MPSIEHEIKISATPDRIFAALSDAEDLEGWEGGKVTLKGDVIEIVYPGGPTFRWRTRRVGDTAIAWRCLDGPGQSPGTEVRFDVSPADRGRSLVELTHFGWRDTGGNYRKCNTHWGALLHGLKAWIEAGRRSAHFS